MGEAGRKTTIRMPESERLNPAEVAALHVEPGGRVTIGAPVMTLVAPRGERIVRASRPGRVTPMVGIGDRVSPGQALLEIEADATARPRRGAAGRDAPVSRRRVARSGGADGWRNPVLAISVYAAACLAVLPALGAVGQGSPVWQRGALILGATLFAVAAFRLYAPPRRGWARGAVGLVAAAWAGAVGLVALHPATVERPVPAASAASVALLPTDARALPTPAPLAFPADVAEPTLRPTSPGERAPVHAGSVDRLASWGGAAPAAHDVTARPSSRQDPGTRAGERPDPAAADRPLSSPEPLAGVAAAWPLPLWRPASVSPSATALPPAALASVPTRPGAAPDTRGSARDSRAGAAEAGPAVLQAAFVTWSTPAAIVPARLDQASAAAGAEAAGMIVPVSSAEPEADEGVLAQDSLPPEGVRVISPSREEAPAPEPAATPPEEQEAATAEPTADAAPTGPIFRAAPGSGLEDRAVRTLRLTPAEAAPEAEKAASAAADAPTPEPAAPPSRFRKPGETHAIPAPQ